MTSELRKVVEATAAVFVAGRRCGSAVLVDNRHLLTAEHVLRCTQDGRQVLVDEVELVFPALSTGDQARLMARRLPRKQGSRSVVDVAVLDLGPAVHERLPRPVLVWPAGRLPRRVKVFGYPLAEGSLKGVWRDFEVAGPTLGDLVQMNWVQAGTFVGHSGGPVIDFDSATLVGILEEGSEEGRFDRFLPITHVAQVWPDLRRPWLMAGPDAKGHFGRRARGQRSRVRGGDLFRGRQAVLSTVSSWLTAQEAPGRPLVITGQPGAGKSAVLGRAMLRLQADRTAPGLAFHSRSATHSDVLAAVADLIGVDARDSRDELLDALAEVTAAEPWLIVLDALDEAATAHDRQQIAETLYELAMLPELRVAVATRPLAASDRERYLEGGLLSTLGVTSADSINLVDLDTDRYFDRVGLEQFAAALLAREGVDHAGPADSGWIHYRANPRLRERLARVVADRAHRNYLVAALAADRLSRDSVVDPLAPGFDPRVIPGSVRDAINKYLNGLESRRKVRVRGLLTALAYARGVGVEDRMWLAFANALDYQASVEDLDELRDSNAADYLLQTIPAERGASPVTRLFHQALTDELVTSRHQPTDESLLVGALLGEVTRTGWATAYLQRHAAEHAAVGGRLDELLAMADYLIEANPSTLLPYLHAARADTAKVVARLYQRVAHHLTAAEPQTRAAILQSAAMRDEPALMPTLSFRVEPVWRTVWAESPTPAHQTLTGHTGPVLALASITLGGLTLLASGADDGIRVWNAASGLRVTEFAGHTNGPVTALTFAVADDGRVLLASAGYDDTVRVWDVDNSRQLLELRGHRRYPTGLVWITHPGAMPQLVSASMDGTMRWWDLARQEASRVLTADDSGVTCLTTVDNPEGGQFLASAGRNCEVRLWDPITGSRVGTFSHGNSVRSLTTCKLPNKSILIAAGADGETVRFWDVNSRRKIRQFSCGTVPAPLTILTLSGRRPMFATPAPHEPFSSPIGLYKIEDGVPVATLEGHTQRLDALATVELPDGRVLLASGAADSTVRLWDLSDPERLVATGRHTRGGAPIAVFEDAEHGATIIVGERDGTLHYRDMVTGAVRASRRAHDAEIRMVARRISHDGHEMLVTVSQSYTEIRLWDPTTTEAVASYPASGFQFGPVLAFVTDPKGHHLIATSDAVSFQSPLALRFIDTNTRHEEHATLLDGSALTALASTRLLNGSNVVALGDHNGTIRLWNVTANTIDLKVTVPVIYYGVHDLGFLHLSDGRTWLIATSDAIYIWDLATGQLVHSMTGHMRYVTCQEVTSLPDGRPILVTGSPDCTLRVWDPVAGRNLITIPLDDAVMSAGALGTLVAVSTARGMSVIDIGAGIPPASDRSLTCQGPGIDPQVFEESFKQAAQTGDPRAMISLAMLSRRRGDNSTAEYWLIQAAGRSDPEATFLLGLWHHERGDAVTAEKWWRQAVESGSVYAARCLAVTLIELNKHEEAEEFARVTADSKHIDGMYLLGKLAGRRGDTTMEEAWYRRALREGGCIESAYRLSVLLDSCGESQEAERLLERAAKAKHAAAISRLRALRRRGGRADGAETPGSL